MLNGLLTSLNLCELPQTVARTERVLLKRAAAADVNCHRPRKVFTRSSFNVSPTSRSTFDKALNVYHLCTVAHLCHLGRRCRHLLTVT
eukprot:5412239-Amphidinium_carterae.1